VRITLHLAPHYASFLQLSKILAPIIHFRLKRLRVERSAGQLGADLRKLQTIKNPASSAGRIRLSLGPLSRCLRRMYSKLDSCYPVLVTNLTSGDSRQTRYQNKALENRAPPTTEDYINFSSGVKQYSMISLKPSVDFSPNCGKG
jgi:hypothetical protein